jgi:FKBP-type peptidyl-prolyl cis-trans isomerase
LARSRINRGSQRKEELRIRAQEIAEARAQRSSAKQIELLDARLGKEVGACRERAKLVSLLNVEKKAEKIEKKEKREKKESKMSKKEKKARTKRSRARAKANRSEKTVVTQVEDSGLLIHSLSEKWGVKQ